MNVIKVLYTHNNKLYSAFIGYLVFECACDEVEDALVEYSAGKVIVPKYPPVMTFADLDCAVRWIRNQPYNTELWLARTTDLLPYQQVLEHATNIIPFSKGEAEFHWIDPPQGTVFCGSVTLIEKVSYD